jgi:hypothetical protein
MFPTLRLVLAGVSALFLVTLGTLGLTDTSTDRLPARVTSTPFSARGAMIDRNDHPEWRQFLVQAAMRRADELARLRELPDQPDVNAIQLRWASLPVSPQDPIPDDAADPTAELPTALSVNRPTTSPSEPQANEAPAAEPAVNTETAAAISPAVAVIVPAVAKKKPVRRTAKRAPPQPMEETNPFAALFGQNPSTQRTAASP